MQLAPEVTDLQPIAAFKVLELPVVGRLIKGGFSNIAENFFHSVIDLNDIVIKHPNETFYGHAWSDSMEPAIAEGSILVIDQKLEPVNGKLIVAEIDENLCMKRYFCENGRIRLASENPKYKDIFVTEDTSFEYCGRITHIINIV